MEKKKKYPSKASEVIKRNENNPALTTKTQSNQQSFSSFRKRILILILILILELVVTTSHFCNSDAIQNSPWARVFSIKSCFLATIIKLFDTIYAAAKFNTLRNRFRASMHDAETNSRTKLTGNKKWGGGGRKVRHLTAHFHKYSLDIILVSLIESYKVIYCIYRGILLNMIGIYFIHIMYILRLTNTCV